MKSIALSLALALSTVATVARAGNNTLPDFEAGCPTDHTSVATDGTEKNCTPYVCRGTQCEDSCVTSEDCIAPATCSNNACITVQDIPHDSSSGGCATARTNAEDVRSPVLGMLGIVAAYAFKRRRRNARRDV